MTNDLDRLAALLRRRPLTAREIAERLKCCTPTAYQRVAALRARGEAVYTLAQPQKRPGPVAQAFGIR